MLLVFRFTAGSPPAALAMARTGHMNCLFSKEAEEKKFH